MEAHRRGTTFQIVSGRGGGRGREREIDIG